MFWVLLFLFFRLLYSISCPEIEKQSLLTFKQSLHDPSNFFSSWDFKVDCCTWEGIFCSNVTGHVLRLDLQGNSLGGEINSSLLNLKHLKYLDLSRNNFHLKIPSIIGSLTSLEYLSLDYAGFYGMIPHNIGNLSNLYTLSLSNSERLLDADSLEWLSGLHKLENFYMNGVNLSKATNWAQQVINNLPSLVELQMYYCSLNLMAPLNDIINISRSNLATLDISCNSLPYAIIPPWIFQLTDLIYLDMSFNSLEGPIPTMSNTTKLQQIYLSNNNLNSSIPQWLSSCKHLHYLYLENNKLRGNLPESIGKLVNLTELSIYNNMLEGVVTETHFVNLSNLDYLYASGNHLTLKFNTNWIPPFKLETLRLRSCDLGSPFPLWLETQKESISQLDLSCTGIYGNVPSWLWSLNLGYLNLSHNQLDGMILSISDRVHDYYVFDLSSNKFSGPLPRILTSSLPELNLFNNSFSGDLSEFVCNTSTNNGLGILNLGENQLSGDIPDCFLRWQSLQVLDLGNNKLSGRVPNSIGFLKRLVSLNLHGNNFSGHIPSSLQNCTELIKIDFGGNNLGGDIPNWIDTRFHKLRFLVLQSNNLSGEISPFICQLTSLQVLDLSNNKLSGRLPQCLNNLTTMTTKRIFGRPQSRDMPESFAFAIEIQEGASIALKGRELTYNANLFLVISIDLSMNNLSGDIPREITSLVELRSVNLSRNNLTRSIPDNTGNMKELESLDFSMNSLSGNIPGSITTMSFLNSLNLSYNHLTGRIPESTQIGSLNESSFIGNNLCGSPLKISCRNGSNAATPTNVENKGREGGMPPEINWFYVFLSLGYAVGVSAVVTTLFFKHKWREAYYAFLQKVWDSVYVYFVIKWRRLTRVLGRNS
ncbi:disease resistance family protein / LRR family protein [Striga hermonthica]|uniref:Disease resistance family protein / LRR family protein n=1 Tax=Striga hermonthica TaxID=68872 RepID=A0A9N7N4E6_STRHE|nr:disease resistance family protein / LRR family protein [Striga hermonthica]